MSKMTRLKNGGVSRSQDEKNPSQKLRAQKSDYPIWDTEVSGFLEEIESD
jgi:hypothetical protein